MEISFDRRVIEKEEEEKKMLIKTSPPLIKSVNRGIQFRRVRWSHYCAKLPLPPPIFTCALRFTNLRGVSRSSFPCFRSFSMFCRREIGENDSILARWGFVKADLQIRSAKKKKKKKVQSQWSRNALIVSNKMKNWNYKLVDNIF